MRRANPYSHLTPEQVLSITTPEQRARDWSLLRARLIVPLPRDAKCHLCGQPAVAMATPDLGRTWRPRCVAH